MRAKSLQTFQQTIAEVMVLGDVSSWDGRTLKGREQQIRQAALILAGQCIALLLDALTQSRQAHITAANKLKDGALSPAQDMGSRCVKVLTLGNVVISLWLPYVVERNQERWFKSS